MDSFIHLEVQSAFSFLWGTFTPEDLIKRVATIGQKAVALTDFGLHGAVRFTKVAVAYGIQPIVGAKVGLMDGSTVVLLTLSFEGYGNLCRILSVACEGGAYPTNPVSLRTLFEWNRGLLCLAGLRNSGIHTCLEAGHLHTAKEVLSRLQRIFTPPRLFLTLQNPHNGAPSPEVYTIMESAREVAADVHIPIVASNEVVFLNPEDYRIHRVLVDIQRLHHHRQVRPLGHDGHYLASEEEMVLKIPYPEAHANTGYIAELCGSFRLPLGKLHAPLFQPAQHAATKLNRLCFEGLARLRRPAPYAYLKQLEKELTMIHEKKLADFFLLVEHVISFARKQDIRHSVRGSAAGSLVVYLLLGGVDPIEHDLLFERFINEGRTDLPDIDVDFDSERRDEVMEYLFGFLPNRTAMVATIHCFKARIAVRLAAKALGYPLQKIDGMASCLPWSLRGSDLISALENLPELKDSELKHEPGLVSIAAQLIGLPFQASVHLGGVIIAPEDIKHWTPVGNSPGGLPVGHLDKDDVDALGLLKLDVLGLRMHTAIRKSLEILKKRGVCLDFDSIPLNDPKTYWILKTTDSLGVFQVESPGQRNLLGRLQPKRFDDLIAEISLFRPGPVEGNIVEPYVKRKNGGEPVEIPHKSLYPILGETYGVILFQEQVLKIVRVLAGFSYGEADAFRRAMTKDRTSKKMEVLRERFIQGMVENGYSFEFAVEMFGHIAAFASYGFCKAHAASFAHITYQSAYLKAYYPQAFYLGLLNAGQVGSYPPHVLINEARRKGIPIYCPHINFSGVDYEPEGEGIRVPLTHLRQFKM